MARQFSQLCVYILLLSTFLQTRQIRCLRRLTRRKLSAEADDIRSLVSSSLDSDPSQMTGNIQKRETSGEDLTAVDTLAEDNVASESKDASVYEDEADEADSDEQRDLEDSEYERNVESDSSDDSPADSSAERIADQADVETYDDPDVQEVKDITKREAKNENDYDEDANADASISSDGKVADVEARSTNAKKTEDLEKKDNRREANAEAVNFDLNLEKQIEDQIQQRIDSIKEDIKREIEKKQQVREIEANNAKYDQLEFNRGDNEIVDNDKFSDSSKRSISREPNVTKVVEKSNQGPALRSKRSDIKVVVKSEENKEPELGIPVKRRSVDRRVTLVEKRDLRGVKRKDRSSILIPERGHADVKDELPGDLTLDSNLRLARSDLGVNAASSGGSRSTRSVVNREDEAAERYRREMADLAENEEGAMREANFLFPAREKSDYRMRRRRSRKGKKKKKKKHRKHPRTRRHRATRESSVDDEPHEERNKRAMSLNDEAALEYNESFGGLQSDTGGILGRFKRIRRSSEIT